MQKNKKGIEGFVVKFTDESIIKIKTLDYVELHRLNDESDSYKSILSRVLNEEIDDIMSVVSDTKREYLKKCDKGLSDYVSSFTKEIFDVVMKEKDHERKEVAEKYKGHPYFGVIMKNLRDSADIQKIKNDLIQLLLKKYNREKASEKFIKELLD